MANFLQILVPLLWSLAVANPASSQKISFAYDFAAQQPTDLTFQGDAHYVGVLRLTKTDAVENPVRYSAGRVMYPTPIQFWESGAQVDFETTIEFLITPVDKNPGDGLVFFIAPVGSTIPAGHTGGNFGVFTTSVGVNPSIFVVEFDTFSNSLDPPYRHIGIDIIHQESKNTTRVDDAILNKMVTAHITYNQATKMIRASIRSLKKVFDVSYVYDLSTVLNQQVQVGLAATTGGAVSIHDVMSWKFNSTLVHTKNDI